MRRLICFAVAFLLLLTLLSCVREGSLHPGPDDTAVEPIVTEPAETASVATEPIETEPDETEPVATEPVETEPIATEPIETEPVETEPIATEPIETEPIETEPPKPIDENYYIALHMYDDYILSYRAYSQRLLDYIGADQADDWFWNTPMYWIDENGEIILRCFKDILIAFNVTQEEYEYVYYCLGDYYPEVHDIELLYHGTRDEMEAFYRDRSKVREADRRAALLCGKVMLRTRLAEWTDDPSVIEKYQTLPLTAWTFADVIYEIGMSRETMEQLAIEFYLPNRMEIDYDLLFRIAEEIRSGKRQCAVNSLSEVEDPVAYCKQQLATEERIFRLSSEAECSEQ